LAGVFGYSVTADLGLYPLRDFPDASLMPADPVRDQSRLEQPQQGAPQHHPFAHEPGVFQAAPADWMVGDLGNIAPGDSPGAEALWTARDGK
jgi:hypothetical protein